MQSWSEKQGSILTGGGILSQLTSLGLDYQEHDLPHHILQQGSTRSTIQQWLHANHRSYYITGCWYRPLFAGGWLESTDTDTIAYNLQTPSIFIDMRFPRHRPVERIRLKSSLNECNELELKVLAQQHCFAGYSYLEEEDTYRGATTTASTYPKQGPLYTRHHLIDWNYHPKYPRLRPNRWWIDLKADRTSFKEYSFARDDYGIPVYHERWERRSNDSDGKRYLAIRRRSICPYKAFAQGLPAVRESLLVLVGNWFAYVADKKIAELPDFATYSGPSSAGCAALVDHALSTHDREAAIRMLDLLGAVGEVGSSSSSSSSPWEIIHCTHPWMENTSLIDSKTRMLIQLDGRGLCECLHWNDDIWDVLENSYSVAELQEIFRAQIASGKTIAKDSHSKL
jgi:hypothetical protein